MIELIQVCKPVLIVAIVVLATAILWLGLLGRKF